MKKKEDLNKKIEEIEKQKEEYLSGWKRERADFLNYKKEELERIKGAGEYVKEDVVLKLLPVLDNFDLAEKSIPKKALKDDNIRGLLFIKLQFEKMLESLGVERINCLNEDFDPMFCEVMEQVKGKKSGKVVEEVQKGYKLNGKVIRPAKVKVVK